VPFYESFDFKSTGKEYLEDDIPHTEMLLSKKNSKFKD
jgi:ElaA protein